MTRDEHILYWLQESDKDCSVMTSLLDNGHFTWALFVGHLVIEKLLKAIYVQNIDSEVPRIHHLLKIARDAGLEMTVDQENFLLEVTTYNIKGRYPDYKKQFARKANRDFTHQKVGQIKEMRRWLKNKLQR